MSTGPVVLDGRVRYVSVSQIERFDTEVFGGCQRKWWLRYVGGLKETQGKAAKLGEQVHAQLEHYLKTGEDVLGELARAGRRFIPAPVGGPLGKPGLRVERPIGGLREHLPGGVLGAVDSELTCAGVPVIGRLDVVDERVEHVLDDPTADGGTTRVVEPGVVEVLDWKTTRQIDDVVDPETGTIDSRGYAKSTAEMSNTHQMVGYAELVKRTYGPGLRAVRVSHAYFQTGGARLAVKRSAVLQLDEISRRFSRSEAVVERMSGVAATPRIEDVPANYKACNAYGGCHFKDKCPRDPKAVMAEVFGTLSAANLTKRLRRVDTRPMEGAMSLLDRVNAKKAAEKGGTPAKTETASPVETKPADPAVDAAKEALLAEETALKAGVTPPDAPEPKEIAKLPDVGQASGTEPGCPVGGTTRKLDIDGVATKTFSCVCGEVVKVKPKKLGDGEYYAVVPKHGEVEEKLEAEPEPAVAEKPATPDVSPKAQLAAVKASAEVGAPLIARQPGLTLYLDSIEDGVVATRLEAYAERLAVALADEFKAADIRSAPADSPLAFGKYKGALAAYVRAEPPCDGAYLVSSSSEFGMIAFEALAPRARCVRGVK